MSTKYSALLEACNTIQLTGKLGILEESSVDEATSIKLQLVLQENINFIKNQITRTPLIENVQMMLAEKWTQAILEDISFEKVRAKTLSEVYKNCISFVKEQIAQDLINKSNLKNTEIPNDRVDEFLSLQKELEILSEKMRNENQLKKRVEISLEINKLKVKIDNLRSI